MIGAFAQHGECGEQVWPKGAHRGGGQLDAVAGHEQAAVWERELGGAGFDERCESGIGVGSRFCLEPAQNADGGG